MIQNAQTRMYRLPQTLLGRLVAGTVAIALLAVAFFFLFFFLIIAGIALLGFSVRALWRGRSVRTTAPPDVIEGEYTVEVVETKRMDNKTSNSTDGH